MAKQKRLMIHKRIKVDQAFDYLTVLSEPAIGKAGKSEVRCRCKCGKELTVRTGSLLSGNTKSCSCLQKEKVRTKNLKHGYNVRGGRSEEYSIWANMCSRCTQNNEANRNYVGRGIKVCDRWLNSFADFLADMGHRPGPDYSIDRIDNDGDYTPDNCRWATIDQQSRNKRSNRRLTLGGQTMLMTDWAARLGISMSALHGRLRKWPLDVALTRPPQKRGTSSNG